jgi:LAGLIDADG DNA endonuclease family protein
MASETELAWAAGLFEGEGCFTVRRVQHGWRAQFEMTVTSTDLDVVQQFARIAGCGYIKARRTFNAKPHWKGQHTWACGGAAALVFAESLLPLLGKRRRARHAEILTLIEASQPQPRACECCSETFTPTRFARERFCSDRCRERAKYLRRRYGVTSEESFAAMQPMRADLTSIR